MKKRKSLIPVLGLGILSLIGLCFYIFFIDPQKSMSAGRLFISPVLLFFVLFFATVSGMGSFLFINIRRGALLGVFLSAILVLRMFGFTSYLYIGILLIIVLLLELGFRKR